MSVLNQEGVDANLNTLNAMSGLDDIIEELADDFQSGVGIAESRFMVKATLQSMLHNVLIEVLCCCEPNNIIGYVPFQAGAAAGLVLRELEDGGIAFDSQHNEAAIRAIDGFIEAKGKGDKKTWRKR